MPTYTQRRQMYFQRPECESLGHIMGSDGTQPDPDKIQAIINMPHPTNPHEIRSFPGMLNHAVQQIYFESCRHNKAHSRAAN